MAAPNALVALKVHPHPLGWQNNIDWWYPDELPQKAYSVGDATTGFNLKVVGGTNALGATDLSLTVQSDMTAEEMATNIEAVVNDLIGVGATLEVRINSAGRFVIDAKDSDSIEVATRTAGTSLDNWIFGADYTSPQTGRAFIGGDPLVPWRMIIFKKTTQAASDAEIAAILAGTEQDGVSAFVFDDTESDRLFDQDVANGTVYYYTGLIQDTDTDEISDKLTASATPAYSAELNFPDCKALVVEAVEKLMRNHGIVPEKDIFIQKTHSIENAQLDLITVVRTPNNVFQEYTGHIVQWEGAQIAEGRVDQDNILVVWSCNLEPRRDYLTGLFRAALPEIRAYLQMKGQSTVLDVHAAIGGDAKDERWEEGYAASNSMAISCVVEVKQTMADSLWREPLAKFEYQGPEG